MGGDRINVKIDGGIPPSGGQTYCKEDLSAYGGRRLVMDPSGRCPEDIRDMAHQGVYSYVIDHNFIACFLLSHI